MKSVQFPKLPKKQYGIIYADPPWDYKGQKQHAGAGKKDTGGGFRNLNRVKSKVCMELDNLPEPPPIFKLLQERLKFDYQMMYSTFNMGIGFCVIVSAKNESYAQTILESFGKKCTRIGTVSDKPKGVNVYVEGERHAIC